MLTCFVEHSTIDRKHERCGPAVVQVGRLADQVGAGRHKDRFYTIDEADSKCAFTVELDVGCRVMILADPEVERQTLVVIERAGELDTPMSPSASMAAPATGTRG